MLSFRISVHRKLTMLLFLAFAGTLLSAVRGQDCNWINALDCASYGYHPLCGSNYVTYTSRCQFAKFHCANPGVNILSETTCVKAGFTERPTSKMTTTETTRATTSRPVTQKPTDVPVTPGPTVPTVPTTTHKPVFLGHDLVFDFFCLELSHNPCPDDTEKVCGSDLKIYSNFCEFEKQRCSHRNLTVAHFNAC